MHLACLIHMHLTSPQLRDQSLLSQQKWTVWIITKIKWSHTEPSYSWTDLTLCLTCGPLLPWTWDLMTQGHSVRLDAMLCLQSLPLCPSPPHQEPSPTLSPMSNRGVSSASSCCPSPAEFSACCLSQSPCFYALPTR